MHITDAEFGSRAESVGPHSGFDYETASIPHSRESAYCMLDGAKSSFAEMSELVERIHELHNQDGLKGIYRIFVTKKRLTGMIRTLDSIVDMESELLSRLGLRIEEAHDDVDLTIVVSSIMTLDGINGKLMSILGHMMEMYGGKVSGTHDIQSYERELNMQVDSMRCMQVA